VRSLREPGTRKAVGQGAHKNKDPQTPPQKAARTGLWSQHGFSSGWVKFLLGYLVLLAAVTLAYQPAWFGGFLWDDVAHVTKPELQSTHGLYRIWFDLGATQQYYPLTHSAFWVEHKLWGDQVLGYHVANLLLHALAATLVGAILLKLKIPGAYLAAGIFALHPVCVESVAWITELKNTLSATFYLGAALTYLHYDEKRRPGLYAAALGLFVLGLMSKTVTATLPGALLVIFWWKRGSLSWRRDVLPLITFFVLGAIGGMLTAWVEYKYIGAQGSNFDLTLLERGLLAGRVVWFYLAKVLWPTNLMFIYPRWVVSGTVWWQYLYPAGLAGLMIALWALRKRTRGPLAGMLYLGGTLFPVLGFFNVYPFVFSYVADHFQYLASLGVITLAAAGIATFMTRWRMWERWEGRLLCGVLLAALGTMSWSQSRLYADAETLYRETVAVNPGCWMARGNLGTALLKAGRYEEAIEEYRAALKANPNLVLVHNELGGALAATGRVEEAIREYREALRQNPQFTKAHGNLGTALFRAGQFEEAIAEYRLALKADPRLVLVRNNLGGALAATGRIDEAIAEYRAALKIGPDYAEVHQCFGEVLIKAGRVEEAIREFEEALRLNPNLTRARTALEAARRRLGTSR
jgi:protein O-mannosyl-transferase